MRTEDEEEDFVQGQADATAPETEPEPDPEDEAERAAPDQAQPKKDAGELYGVHTPRATDRDLARNRGEDYQDSTLGENWIEALETAATEGGAEPEREVDVTDDEPEHPVHGDESGDRPVADKGSGGPGGL